MDLSWLVQKSRNIENVGNFVHFSKNIPTIEILVFFHPVEPQDTMFENNSFFNLFSSFSKVRGKKRERRVAYDLSILTGPDSGNGPEFPQSMGFISCVYYFK